MGAGPLQNMRVPAGTSSVCHADVPAKEHGMPHQLQDASASWRMLPTLR